MTLNHPHHLLRPYLDLLGMFLTEAEGHVVHLHGDHLGEGDQAAATVIVLHSDSKGDEGGVSGAEPSQEVNTGTHEVITAPIEGGIVGVTSGHADGTAVGHTLPHALHHRAHLTRLTPGVLAHHHSQLRVTPAPGPTGVIAPKLLTRAVVAAITGAATLGHWHTLPATEHIASVTGTGLHAGLVTSGWIVPVGAGGWTGTATGLIVAVFRAR